jgi:hypothetical protein
LALLSTLPARFGVKLHGYVLSIAVRCFSLRLQKDRTHQRKLVLLEKALNRI